MKHWTKSNFFFSAPDESAIAFGETFPSNICCLLTVICYCSGRVYLLPQPATNMKFASGPLDFILTYFSVFSEENSFSCCSLLSAGRGSSLVLPPCSLPVSTSPIPAIFFFVLHCVPQPETPCQSWQPVHNVQEVVTLCSATGVFWGVSVFQLCAQRYCFLSACKVWYHGCMQD